MFSVPEVHPLFGSTHAVGDNVRETVESEASVNIGSRAGDENAPIHTKDMLEHLTLGDRSKDADNTVDNDYKILGFWTKPLWDLT